MDASTRLKIALIKIDPDHGIARRLGISRQRLSLWVRRGKIRTDFIIKIWRLGNGAVSLSELDPEIYPPELFKRRRTKKLKPAAKEKEKAKESEMQV